MSNKIGNILNYIYDRLILIIAILLLLFGVYILIDTHYVRTVAAGNSFYVYKPDEENINNYSNISEECIGWITLDDTTLDYPLMQGENDTKYLNTAPDGSYSLAGSLFLHWKNKNDFIDKFNLIHGHHMAEGLMLGCLDLFYDKEYFNSHTTGTLIENGRKHKLQIFSLVLTDANEKEIYDPTEYNFEDQFNIIKEKNIFYREPINKDRIIALSTCKDPGTTERTILFCSIID